VGAWSERGIRVPLLLPLVFIGIAAFVGTLALLSAAISAFEIRQRRLTELRQGRPLHSEVTPSAKAERPDVDPAPLLSGILQNSKLGKQLQLLILRAGLVWRPSEFVALTLASILLGYIIGILSSRGSISMGIILALVASLVPYVYLKAKQARRQAHLSAQIPDMLDILSSSLRSGHSFLSGVQLLVSQMQPPLTDEFARVIQEVKFGASLSNALGDLVHRTESYDMELIVSAVQTQLAVGGNLAEILDQIGTMIRDRIALAGEMSAATAEGRFSAMILVGMPFALAFIVNSVSPGYLSPLVSDPLGRMMLGGAAGLMVVGVLIIRKMLDVDL